MGALEKSRLNELERTIAGGLQTFVEVGAALAEVRDDKLYKEAGFNAFETYCEERWGWQRNYANKLIAAAATSKELGTIVPTSEGQVRPLTKLPPAKQAEAWDIAVEKAAKREQPITGKLVQEAVNEVVADISPTKPPAKKTTRENARIIRYIRDAVRELKQARKELPRGEIESRLHVFITGLKETIVMLEDG